MCEILQKMVMRLIIFCHKFILTKFVIPIKYFISITSITIILQNYTTVCLVLSTLMPSTWG